MLCFGNKTESVALTFELETHEEYFLFILNIDTYVLLNLSTSNTPKPKLMLNLLVAGTGFEPVTFGLWAQRATTAPSCFKL